MKKITSFWVVMAMALCLCLSAGNVLAGDADVGGDGTAIGMDVNNASNSNATADAVATSDQEQNQNQNQGQSVITPRQFLQAPGFVTGIIPGTAPESGEWAAFCPSSEPMSIENINRAAGDTGFWHDFRNGRKSMDVTEVFEPLDREIAEMLCLPWPKDFQWVTVNMTLAGDTRAPMMRAVSSIQAECAQKGWQYYAVRGGLQSEVATYGKSLGLSGAASEVNSKTGTAAAVGGQLGNNRVRSERYWEFEGVCLSDEYAASLLLVTPPPVKVAEPPCPPPAKVAETPCPLPPAKAAEPPCCNPDEIILQLKGYDIEIIWCEFPCKNNQDLRFGKGTKKLDLYYCEGGKSKQLPLDAIYEFGVAERDYNNGRELAPGQHFGEKPKGVATTSVPEARATMLKVYWNWSLAIRESSGPQAQYKFAQLHKSAFIGKDGKLHVPTCSADIKH